MFFGNVFSRSAYIYHSVLSLLLDRSIALARRVSHYELTLCDRQEGGWRRLLHDEKNKEEEGNK